MKVHNLCGVILFVLFFYFTLIRCGDNNESLTSNPQETSGEITQEQAKSFADNDAQAIAEQSNETVNGSIATTTTEDMGKVPTDEATQATFKGLLQKLKETDCNVEPAQPQNNEATKKQENNKSDGEAQASVDCQYTITEGSKTDADCDGIPAHMVAKFDCDIQRTDSSFKTSGKFTVDDKNDNAKGAGYKFNIDDFNYTYTLEATSSSPSQEWKGSSAGTFESTVTDGKYHTDYDFGYNTVYTKKDVSSQSTLYGFNLTSDYVPEADGNDDPYDAGTISSLTGFYRFEYKNQEGDSKTETKYTLAVDGKDLVNPSTPCATAFQSGTLTFTDSANNVTVITYTNCTYSATYNGQPL